MTISADAARESARRSNGQFGAQVLAEDTSVDLSPAHRVAEPTCTLIPVRDLREGQVVHRLGRVTNLYMHGGSVSVWTDGDDPDGAPTACYPTTSTPLLVEDRPDVDLTDPDDFEREVDRLVETRRWRRWDDGGVPTDPDDTRLVDLERAVRLTVTKMGQPSNRNPRLPDDPRQACGRAKVGDEVVFRSPQWADKVYRVLDKKPVLLPETSWTNGVSTLTWVDSGDIDYVLEDIHTGAQTTSDLRQAGWLRFPADDDQGPAARRLRGEAWAPSEHGRFATGQISAPTRSARGL